MTIETDGAAILRASEFLISDFENFETANKGDGSGGVPIASPPIKAIFLIYMRINEDGSFAAYRYLYVSDGSNIDPNLDERVPNCVGSISKDMILHARSRRQNNLYAYEGAGLDFRFPSYRSYCVFMFDDEHWKFLLKHGKPVIKFNSQKDGKPFVKPTHAFKNPRLASFEMANRETDKVTTRQAAVMINTMKNINNRDLQTNEEEMFSFDLWMRIKYAHSENGVTLIIDPTGGNMGPPK